MLESSFDRIADDMMIWHHSRVFRLLDSRLGRISSFLLLVPLFLSFFVVVQSLLSHTLTEVELITQPL